MLPTEAILLRVETDRTFVFAVPSMSRVTARSGMHEKRLQSAARTPFFVIGPAS